LPSSGQLEQNLVHLRSVPSTKTRRGDELHDEADEHEREADRRRRAALLDKRRHEAGERDERRREEPEQQQVRGKVVEQEEVLNWKIAPASDQNERRDEVLQQAGDGENEIQ
jgi:hypothetical protein